MPFTSLTHYFLLFVCVPALHKSMMVTGPAKLLESLGLPSLHAISVPVLNDGNIGYIKQKQYFA